MAIWTTLLSALAVAAGLMLVAWLLYRETDKASWVDVFWAANLAVLALWYAASQPGDPTRRLLVAVVGGLWGARLAGYLALRVAGVPLTEKQAVASKGDAYRAYQREVSAFVPWFPAKR